MPTLQEQARTLAQQIIGDATEETRNFLERAEIARNDRLHVDLDKTHDRFHVKATSTTGYASHDAALGWVKRIPERRKLSTYGEWLLAATDTTAIILITSWDECKIEFTKKAKIIFDYLLMRFISGIHTLHNLPARCDQIIDNSDLPLTHYQRTGLALSMGKEGFGLFMPQGTGKTPIVIARICNEAMKHKGIYRVLIVCPKNVRRNWENEFKRFATIPGRCCILSGGELDRTKSILEINTKHADRAKEQWFAVICSYDSVGTTWNAIKLIPWDLAVADESHNLKSVYTKRYKAFQELREVCKNRMALTGTPVTNGGPLDLYAQLEWLGRGYSGFNSWKGYKKFYGKYIRIQTKGEGRDHNMMVGFQNIPLLQERLTRFSFTVDKQKALPDLPPKTYDIVEVEMTLQQTEVYNRLRDDLFVEITRDIQRAEDRSSGGVIVINSILTKLLRLAQITSGFVVTTHETLDCTGDPILKKETNGFKENPKLESLIEICKEHTPREKLIIWASWVWDIKTIYTRLQQEGLDCVKFYGATSDRMRDAAVDRFNNHPKCRFWVGNPAAGGQGLNLLGHGPQSGNRSLGVTRVIYYSQNWSMVARAQSEDRCHRIGTRANVLYTDLCVPKTIDEEIRVHVLKLGKTALEIQDVKDIMRRVFSNA